MTFIAREAGNITEEERVKFVSVLNDLTEGFKHVTNYMHTITTTTTSIEEGDEEITLHTLLALVFPKFTRLFNGRLYRSEEANI